MTRYTVGVVGLGLMGGNMAANLLERDFDVLGFDVSDDAVAAFEADGGSARDAVGDLAGDADVVITSLPNPETVEAVYTEADGLLAGASSDTVAIEMSTIDPETTLALDAAASEAGVDLLGAPVSGGPQDSRDGTLTIMAGGPRAVFDRERAQTVLEALGDQVYYTGDVDAGHTVKLLNNVMSMGNLLLAMEAVSLGAARGIDGEVMLDVLSNAGGGSNQLEKRLPRVLNRNFEASFTVDYARKDVGLAVETAAAMDRPLFLGSLVQNLYTEASAEGYGAEDAAAVVKLFEADDVVEARGHVDESYEGY